jgi:hypothetical protein
MSASATNARNEEKLAQLANAYASTVDELLETWGDDDRVPGICMNPGCDYTTEYEPYQREGWCGVCETQSVKSLLILLGI